MLALKVVELMLMLLLLVEQSLLLIVKLLWRGILFHAATDICGPGLYERSRRMSV
jgi:hypothetical protein